MECNCTLKGKIYNDELLQGKLNNAIEEKYPSLEDLEIIPKTEKQFFKSEKYGYDKIEVNAVDSNIDANIVPENIKKDVEILGVVGAYDLKPKLQNKIITENGKYTADEGFDGLGEVIVETNGVDINNYYALTSTGGEINSYIKQIPVIDISQKTSATKMFSGCRNLENVPLLDTSKVTNMTEMFAYCYKLKNIPTLDTSKVTNMSYMFQSSGIVEIPVLDTNNLTNANYMFYQSDLKLLPVLDFSKVTNMTNAFYSCSNLTDEALNNILKICISAVNVTKKTLKSIGLSRQQSTTCQELSNYQEFLDAGWITGY